jgi:hypothetical protein
LSDTSLPGGAPNELPGDAGWPGLLAGTALATAQHPVYDVTYRGDHIFVAGANGPLRFEIRRRDGALVSIPSEAAILVLLPGGESVTYIPDVEQSEAEPLVALSADCVLDVRGVYAARLLAVIGGEVVGAWVETLLCEG